MVDAALATTRKSHAERYAERHGGELSG